MKDEWVLITFYLVLIACCIFLIAIYSNPEKIEIEEDLNLVGTEGLFKFINDSDDRFTNQPMRTYGVVFDNFEFPNGTEEQQRAFIFGYIFGLIGGNFKGNFNITIDLENQSRDYNITNFPLEDDCIDESNCFVKWREDNE